MDTCISWRVKRQHNVQCTAVFLRMWCYVAAAPAPWTSALQCSPIQDRTYWYPDQASRFTGLWRKGSEYKSNSTISRYNCFFFCAGMWVIFEDEIWNKYNPQKLNSNQCNYQVSGHLEIIFKITRTLQIVCFWRESPAVGQGLLIHEVSRSHTTTHHSR